MANNSMVLSPAMLRQRQQTLDRHFHQLGQAHGLLCKQADTPTTVHALAGQLYLSESGWLLLGVPNALVRGLFDALDAPGIELPQQTSGRLNAHISVMNPDDIKQIGGPDKVTERGHTFRYTLGPIRTVRPGGWPEMERVWYCAVKSPELAQLRRSYGLTSLPHDGEYEFHISVATRRRKVLQENDITKAGPDEAAAADKPGSSSYSSLQQVKVGGVSFADWIWRFKEGRSGPQTVAVDLDGTLAGPHDPQNPGAIAAPRPGALELLQELRRRGCRIVIFTVRGDQAQVKSWLDQHGLPYDYVNENPDQPRDSSGKVIADLYLDDRAINAAGDLGTCLEDVRKWLR